MIMHYYSSTVCMVHALHTLSMFFYIGNNALFLCL